jgi:arylsulfatase A-like enzyme
MGLGYAILVTGDHGINKDGAHGGPAPEQREVPLYLIRPDLAGQGDMGQIVSHLQIAPTILKLLDVPIPETMKWTPLD